MTEITVPPTASPPPVVAPKPTVTTRALSWIREFIVAIFWTYAICKLFIFDIDVYLIQSFNPEYIWLADYKFFILLGLLALFLLISSKLNFVLSILYALFYPLIILFWRIPYFIFKQKSWTLLFAIINALISLFKSLKIKFVATTVFILCMFLVLNFSNPIVLLISVIGLLSVLIVSYVRIAMFVFQPSSIFQLYSRFIKKSPDFVFKHLTDKEIRNLPIEKMSDAQIQLRRTGIQSLVICNRALLFFSHRLREYQQSKLNAVSFALSLFLLLLFTIVSYGAVNYALFKYDPSQFSVTTQPGYFLFLYYSFHVFLFGGIAEIAPAFFLSQVISMSEQVLAIVLLFILIGLFISVQSEKYKEELDRTIAETEQTQESLEGLIRSTYNLTLEQALEEIRKMQNNLMALILWLSQDVK